jgi:hypothetical protein
MKKFLSFLLFISIVYYSSGQPTAGTTGLLNIPSAHMLSDGTFSAGVNYLADNVTPQPRFNYNTFNYYVGMAFLPFAELSFRMTIFKTDDDSLRNQDRSLSARVRILKEGKVLPSILIGGNDIFSTTGSGRKYFKSLYIAGTKSFRIGDHQTFLTVGYAPGELIESDFSGIFGGVSFTPSFLKSLTLMADYDTRFFNAGASVLLFKHLFLYGFVSDFDQFAGGLAFRLYPGRSDSSGPD